MSAEQESKPNEGLHCDPKDVLGIECDGERYKKQSEVSQEADAKLKEFKTQYDTARADYSRATRAARNSLKSILEKLDDIESQISCHVPDEIRACLKSAVCDVLDELKECDPVAAGCCAVDLPPETPTSGSEQPGKSAERTPTKSVELTAAIAELRRVTTANTECFTRLGREAEQIGKRISDLESDVSSLMNDLKAEDRSYERLFVRWYIAVRRAKWSYLGGGFDNVDEYMDCLCRTLVLIGEGWRRIILLEGERSYQDCTEKAQKATCERKRANIVDDALSRCTRKPDNADDTANGNHDDCNCGDHTHSEKSGA
jgi:hypothetical protein